VILINERAYKKQSEKNSLSQNNTLLYIVCQKNNHTNF